MDTDESELSENDEEDKTEEPLEIEEPLDQNNIIPCTSESQCYLN